MIQESLKLSISLQLRKCIKWLHSQPLSDFPLLQLSEYRENAILSFPAKYLLNSVSGDQLKTIRDRVNIVTWVWTPGHYNNADPALRKGNCWVDIWRYFHLILFCDFIFKGWNIIQFNQFPRRPVPCNCQYYWSLLNLATLSLALFSITFSKSIRCCFTLNTEIARRGEGDGGKVTNGRGVRYPDTAVHRWWFVFIIVFAGEL